MDFFRKLRQKDALRVIEVELNFIYEVFYTKIQVVHSVRGHISRFVSFSLVVVAFLLFHFKVKKNNFDHFNVKITYALFWVAIGLDTVAFFMLVFSDWTFAALRISSNDSKLLQKIKSTVASFLSWFLIFKRQRWYQCQNQEVLATPFLFRRWYGYVLGYNLVRYCLKGRPTRIHEVHNCFQRAIRGTIHYLKIDKFIETMSFAIAKISQFLCIREVIHFLGFIRGKLIEISGLTDFVDEIRYVSHEPLTKELWEFIFAELKKKSGELDRSSSEPEAAKKISSARGILKLKTMEEHKKEILQLLRNGSNSPVILAGVEMGTKSWMARQIIECATSTSTDGFCSESLWVSLTKNYDIKWIYKAIYDQLSSGSIPEEWEYEDNNSQLDKSTAQGLKIELGPLSPDDSLSLLKERIGEQRVSKIPDFNIQCSDAIKEKTSMHCPAGITVIAGSFNDISRYDTLKIALQKAVYYEKPCRDGVNPLLYYAYNMMQSDVTKNCFWHSLQFVRNYGGVHYNELRTHWIMEGYFDPFDHINRAYQAGHVVLMELIDRAILKMQENNIVVVEGAALNMIDTWDLGVQPV
ncbi:hypothetical protein LWI29_012810 [Acer saccharum]|uniref:DUF4220 domain-containing protein n=1 Tax=Acer saccharum TaxID=4024 RepID=A0AA39VVA7_ACESA|nr:hypothetical protein LWI29_012810 [Acer saccharum]